MKKKCYILCLAVLACFLCTGCKLMYQQLIQGEWVIDRYYLNGSDETSWYTLTYDDYKIKFYDDGSFVETYNFLFISRTVSGTWEIDKKPDGDFGEFQLKLTSESRVRIYDIKEITRENIDISRETEGGDTERIILEPVPEA